jgi:hypothetical protein
MHNACSNGLMDDDEEDGEEHKARQHKQSYPLEILTNAFFFFFGFFFLFYRASMSVARSQGEDDDEDECKDGDEKIKRDEECAIDSGREGSTLNSSAFFFLYI